MFRSNWIATTVASGIFVFGAAAFAQTPPPSSYTANHPTQADQALVQKIRQAITSDSDLSGSGDVKILALNGKVTLRGMVNSDPDKQVIASKAWEIAGPYNVINELTVKPAPKQTAKDTTKETASK